MVGSVDTDMYKGMGNTALSRPECNPNQAAAAECSEARYNPKHRVSLQSVSPTTLSTNMTI